MGQARVSQGVVSAEDGGEAFLLDTASRRYFRLNEAGRVVWRALERGADPLAALTEQYPAVSPEVLRRDLQGILDRLVESGLVRRSTAG